MGSSLRHCGRPCATRPRRGMVGGASVVRPWKCSPRCSWFLRWSWLHRWISPRGWSKELQRRIGIGWSDLPPLPSLRQRVHGTSYFPLGTPIAHALRITSGTRRAPHGRLVARGSAPCAKVASVISPGITRKPAAAVARFQMTPRSAPFGISEQKSGQARASARQAPLCSSGSSSSIL